MKLTALAAAFALLLATSLLGQQSKQESEPNTNAAAGIALYLKGDLDGAIKALRDAVKNDKSNARAWQYLGFAYLQKGDTGEGRKALTKAIDLRTDFLARELNRSDGEIRDEQVAKLKAMLGDQIESQRKLLEILSEPSELEKGQLELDKWTAQAGCVEQNVKQDASGHTVLKQSDLMIRRPRILYKTEPAFPESARRLGINGKVILRGVFAPDGMIKFLEVRQTPGDELTREAIKAATLTRFRPGAICGKPISFSIQLEYSFDTFIH